jgi:NAD+ kinase
VRTATVLTHRRSDLTEAALHNLVGLAAERAVELRFDHQETAKHELTPSSCVLLDAPVDSDVDICFALGGDGTILSALRTYAGTGVPVFGINFGEMGFLATVDREDAWLGSVRALDGDFEILPLPGIELTGERGIWLAINDVSMHRQQGKRVGRGIDRLQPGQRWSGDGVGSTRIRRLIHRASFAHGARARGRAG